MQGLTRQQSISTILCAVALVVVVAALGVQVAAYVHEQKLRRVSLQERQVVLHEKWRGVPPPIPKTIWSYWNSKDLPPLVRTCVASWKKHMPGYTVRLLHDDALHAYMDTDVLQLPWVDSPQKKADLIRLAVLLKHGGIWSDATIVMYGKHPLQDAIESNRYEFLAYRNDIYPRHSGVPLVENFWFATRPNGMIVHLWKTAFVDFFSKHTTKERADMMVDKLGVNGCDVQNHLYFYAYLALAMVLQKLLPPGYLDANAHLQPVTDGNVYHYQARAMWDCNEAMRQLTSTPKPDRPPVVKLCGGDRRALEEQGLEAGV